jgi:hypothetical protein
VLLELSLLWIGKDTPGFLFIYNFASRFAANIALN